jgi:hypothetical protein
MTADELNRLLKDCDLGDDWKEKNFLFDQRYSILNQEQVKQSSEYANDKMSWYFDNPQKFYLLADCNRYHFMWLGHKQTWYTQHGISNPPIGRAYGYWEGQNHNWAWDFIGKKMVFYNWGQKVDPKAVRYDGKGSEAV